MTPSLTAIDDFLSVLLSTSSEDSKSENVDYSMVKIPLFHNCVTSEQKRLEAGLPPSGARTYRLKPKIDGTYAAIVFFRNKEGGWSIDCQSKGRSITPGDDNYGFASWFDKTTHFKKFSLPDIVFKDILSFCIRGEWAGPSIPSKGAEQQLKTKTFFIFEIQIKTKDRLHKIIEEFNINEFMKLAFDQVLPLEDLRGVPFKSDISISIDFSQKENYESAALKLNEIISPENTQSSYFEEIMGLKGCGEGFVLYANGLENPAYPFIKIKTEKYQVQVQSSPADTTPQPTTDLSAYLNVFATQNRLEQIAGKFQNIFLKKDIMKFIQAFVDDVLSESKQELEANNLKAEQVKPGLMKIAREFYLSRCS